MVLANARRAQGRVEGKLAALFPTGYSGMTRIRTGSYREHAESMQIVSGRVGHERVHYEAPPSAQVFDETSRLLRWFNAGTEPDILVRAALTHLWFETIHPFEDGNGRVGRAWVDLLLARDSEKASPGGFEGRMRTKKYAGITSTSRATASRELIELAVLGLLRHMGAGRSTRYYVNLPGWAPEAPA